MGLDRRVGAGIRLPHEDMDSPDCARCTMRTGDNKCDFDTDKEVSALEVIRFQD